jgi:hypothetical protein
MNRDFIRHHKNATKPEDRADVKAAKKARKEKGGVTLEQYRQKHGL